MLPLLSPSRVKPIRPGVVVYSLRLFKHVTFLQKVKGFRYGRNGLSIVAGVTY